VLAFTQIFERRVHKRFTDELDGPGLPDAVRATFELMIRDEKDHLEWVHDWLKPLPEAATLLKKYIEIDTALYHRLLPFLDHLWDIPGLGEELK
jgi:rubrerythrin